MLAEYKRFADILSDDVLAKLEGSHPDFSRFRSMNKPSRSIIIGSLSDADIKSNRSKTTVKNNNLSIKFLLDEFNNSIDVIPSFSIFYRVFPTFEEQKEYVSELADDKNKHGFAKIWKRKNFRGDPISLDLTSNSVEIDLSKFIDEIYEYGLLFTAKNDEEILDFDDENEYYVALNSFKRGKIPNYDWRCKVYLNKSELIQGKHKFNLIEIGMVNLTEKGSYETFLFDCNLEINLNRNMLHDFIYSYDENNEKKFYTNKLRTLNCHAYFDSHDKINTIHYSRFEEEKKSPKTNIGDYEATFEDLASENCIFSLEKLYNLMDEFEKKSSVTLDNNVEFNNFRSSKSNFLKGIDCLKKNSNALKAFKLMNKSFLRNSKGKYSSWRIFQIVFIVSLIPEIVVKSCERNVCDLLHVMTGGGKSESYFGVVIFAAFYDRIIGKSFGVTALTKFPLRMLSIQQLQRISSLFIWAEEIRLEEDILGDPFTVAYYVGNQEDFPKDNVGIIEKINEEHDDLPGKIISTCPICGEKVILYLDEGRSLIMHKCIGCDREFGLFFTDFEIFRVLPTFIVSTVDKLAAIAMQQRLKNIFGGKLDECSEGHGFISRKSKCDVIGCEGNNIQRDDINFNTGPSIIIQDEMHLVKEGFGTIDSHFETLYDAFSYELSNEHYKYIVMTATVNGADKQVKELYNKDLRIFPPKLENDDGEEFFFEYYKENDEHICNRQIIGLKPNNVDNNSAIILSLRYVSEFIKSVEENENFASEMGIDEDSLSKIINSYKSVLSYHLKVSDVHNTRNYVGRNINDSNFPIYRIDPMTLTGDDSLDDIKNVISQVENFDEDKKLQLTSATNVVSHGVDIDNWNLMFFQGIPRSTSEYIQALSRVGRKYHGLIFLWFYPNRVRDISFYQNFQEYHKILQYKVEKVPIARWTKLGFKQTFTSVFNASIINYLSDVLETPLYTVADVKKALADENNKKLIIDFIKKAYVVDCDDLGADYFEENIENEINIRIEHLHSYEGAETFLPYALADSPHVYFKTQTGMRGIQDSVNVKRNLPNCFRE